MALMRAEEAGLASAQAAQEGMAEEELKELHALCHARAGVTPGPHPGTAAAAPPHRRTTAPLSPPPACVSSCAAV